MKHSTIRPGLLVSLKTSINGGIKYSKTVIDRKTRNEDGSETETWETERVTEDADEYARMQKARTLAAGTIRRVAKTTAFGLLAPEADSDLLDAAIVKAREITSAANAAAQYSRLSVYVLVGKVASDDVEAQRAINSELRDLMALMERGISEVDVKKIRDAADKAREIGAMLSPEAAGRVQVAVDAAREVAKRIVKAGQNAAQEIDKSTLRRIAEMRFSFLDTEEAQDVGQVAASTGRELDFGDGEASASSTTGAL
jgi:hypothetical protein